jgi:hypothetical protein
MGKPRLNQIIAVVAGKKTRAEKALTEAYHVLQKPTLFEGLARTYVCRTENGETKPPEKKSPQHTVKSLYDKVEGDLIELFDGVATQDYANCQARADVVVGDRLLVASAPVSYLLFLEKRLVELANFIDKIPLRDGAEDWSFQPESGLFVTPLTRKQVTAKVQEALVLYPADSVHPAQTQLITKDVVVGHWDERRFSGALSTSERDRLLARVRDLSDAVKSAREEANNIEVERQRVGSAIMNYVFGDVLRTSS